MFERYTKSARRAVFYARASSFLKKAPALDSVHLLEGLMWRKALDTQLLFHVREKLPDYGGKPFKRDALSTTINGRIPHLTDDAKRILAWAAREADAMNDYWVNPGHLLLGILREPTSLAAQHLIGAGITIENVRKAVMQRRNPWTKAPL